MPPVEQTRIFFEELMTLGNYSRDTLAYKLDISYSYLCKVMTGEREITQNLAIKSLDQYELLVDEHEQKIYDWRKKLLK